MLALALAAFIDPPFPGLLSFAYSWFWPFPGAKIILCFLDFFPKSNLLPTQQSWVVVTRFLPPCCLNQITV